MRDIDLIPQEYHRKQLFSGWLKKAFISLLLITVLFLILFTLLRMESNQIQAQIEQLQAQKAITNNHRVQLEELNLQKKDLDQQLQLLAGLRSGAAAEQMFITIGAALPDEGLWITGWKFRRAGTPVEKVNNTVNTGYFIVIPQGENVKGAREETWKIETQMTLQGTSIDHSALSDFVLNLTRQPEIEDVRVLNTKLAAKNTIKLVNFSLEIIVSAHKSNTHG